MGRRSSRRANSESRAVTQETSGGRSWGIGLGFVLGIILAILSLSQLPFLVGHGLISRNAASRASAAISDRLGGPRVESLRQSLPGRQIPDDQALPEWQQTLANRSKYSDEAAKLTGVVTLENPQASSTATSPTPPLVTARTGRLVPIRTAKKLAVEAPRPASLGPASAPSQNDFVDEEPQTLLKHARFLIKAGLAPMAAEPLRKVVREAPGTPMAQEAQQTLDSLSRN
jgi:hypothetical protein